MKIKAYVFFVADRGDMLEITARGQVPGSAEWRPTCSVSVTVPMSERARRAYYVGRQFTVTLTPD
jgi:hypothetical protein